MMIYHEYNTAWYVYVMDWGCKEMFDEIVGSGVVNINYFVGSVHAALDTHSSVCI